MSEQSLLLNTKVSIVEGILFLSIVAWAWFSQQWLVGAVLLSIIIGSLLTSWRWEISRQQFHRIGDLTTIIILLVLLYFSFFQTYSKSIFIILKWLPVFFTPVLFAQLFCSKGTVPLGTLFYSARKRNEQKAELDFKNPFAGLSLLSSGAANHQTSLYFIIVVLIFILILWNERSSHGSLVAWCMVILVSVTTAFWTQQGLHNLQSVIENKAIDWLSNWETDPFKTSTSLGDIGELKLSDRIAYRIKATEPLLLHQSSYDRYAGQSWYISKKTFKSKAINQERISKNIKHLTIFQELKRESILALPPGTQEIKGLEGATLQYSEFGVVKLTEAPEFVNYQVSYTGRQEGETGQFDLDIPKQHQHWIQLIKKDLKLEGQAAKKIAETITQYFKTHYKYTLFLGTESTADKALQDFMLNRKAGHCEYFAVASVFLLRSYGIPARLANGFSMQEFDKAEQMYLVRLRHAHAWAIAYIDGYWQAVDSTPSQWLNIEEENSDPLQAVYDWFSSLHFIYKQWRYQQAQSDTNESDNLLWAFAFILSCYLIWRLYSARKQLIQHNKASETLSIQDNHPGNDSALYLIDRALSNTENARLANESTALWAKRIQNEALIAITKIHYSYRFDPLGISENDKEKLKQEIENWLIDY